MVSGCEVVLTVQTRQQQTGELVVNDGAEYVLRRWSCTVQDGRPRAAGTTQLPYVREVEFVLHETFANSHRVVRRAPYRVEEEGWGEFDLVVLVHFAHCPEPLRFNHDLNFHEGEVYEKKYRLTVPNPSPAFLALYNRLATHARKTIPARQTKARKAPPRTDQHSPARRRSSRSPSGSSSDYDSDSSTDGPSDGSAGPRPAAPRKQDTVERPPHKAARTPVPAAAAEDRRQRAPGTSALAHPRKDHPAAPAVRRTASDVAAVAPPSRALAAPTPGRADRAAPALGRTDRAPALGSAGIGSQQRRRRISDAACTPSKSPMDKPHAAVAVAAVKRPPTIGISGVRVPKKRTVRPADDRDERSKPLPPQQQLQPRGEKRSAPEHDREDTALKPAKRHIVATEKRHAPSPVPTSSSSSSSISPPPPRARAKQQGGSDSHSATQAEAAASSREVLIRKRERQRHLSPDRNRDSAAAGNRAPIGLLGKTGKAGVPVAHSRRDVADIAVPKHAPATGMVAAPKAEPKAAPKAERAQQRRRQRDKAGSASGSVDGDSDDSGRMAPAGMAVSPALVDRMTAIMERANLLSDHAIVGFLRLLHTLRVEQEPENAAAITAEAVGRVQTAGEYSCNFSTLAPDAIDKLWAFVA
ncbi:transcription factor TFIIF complex subunit Tfg3 [Coemansia spiralis]|nr:transcription factor TFIIF complex subunit Tfg3 [Coemansia spiralis]